MLFSTLLRNHTLPVNFKELLVSPNDMRKRLIALINKEIKNKEQGKEAYILAKVNHITDRALIEKLYEASTAGVQVELVVRGNCSLVTGIAGISENIHINGIIDRYLEHSRIFTLPMAEKKNIISVLPTGCPATLITGSKYWLRCTTKKYRQT